VSDRWPALLTSSDAAEYLSVSETTLARMRGGDQIKSVRVRGSVRYRRVDLDKLIEELPEEVGEFRGVRMQDSKDKS